jgi:hypothetical protein
MTNGDDIRQMDDYALAILFANIISERDHFIVEKLRSADVSVELIEFSDASIQSHYDWFRKEKTDGEEIH